MAPPRTRGQSAAASRYTAMAAAAGKSPTYNSQISRSQAIKQVQARQTQSDESLSGVPSPFAAILSGIGTATRAKVIKELEAGGTPVYGIFVVNANSGGTVDVANMVSLSATDSD